MYHSRKYRRQARANDRHREHALMWREAARQCTEDGMPRAAAYCLSKAELHEDIVRRSPVR